jgi:hypothetical protein
MRRSVAGGVAAGERHAAVGDPANCFTLPTSLLGTPSFVCVCVCVCGDDS